MNQKRLACLAIALGILFHAHAQIGYVYFDQLGSCLDYQESTLYGLMEKPREAFVKDQFNMKAEQFKMLEEAQIGIYLKNLIVKGKPYVSEEFYTELKEKSTQEVLCSLYDWYAFSREKAAANLEKKRELERSLYLRPLSAESPVWALRVWQYDLSDNYYNIFEINQKEDKTIKADYLKFRVDEKGVMLDSFDNNVAALESPSLLLAKLQPMRLAKLPNQSSLPFFRHADGIGKVLVIEIIEGDKKEPLTYYDVEKYAEKDAPESPHKKLITLLQLIEQFYGAKLE